MSCVESMSCSMDQDDCVKCLMGCGTCGNNPSGNCLVYPKLVIKTGTCWAGTCRLAGKGASPYAREIRISSPQMVSRGREDDGSSESLEQEASKKQGQASDKKGQQQKKRGV